MYDISVIICTYNQAEKLRGALESWLLVQNAESKVELIIVDNNSTDQTQQVVESFQIRCPSQLRYVCETTVGLSFARNKGIDEASGGIIAFVDDDVYFDKGWLKAMLKAFNDNPKISCVGGKSIPKFEADKPDWITEDFLKIYGSTGSGDQGKLMIFPEHPFGVNMAFRKAVFTQVGEFNTSLGRRKKSLLSNEEKDIFYRINNAGLKVFYSPEAILYHRIPADRMEKSWILKRIYWQAISDVIFDQSIQKQSKFVLFKNLIRSIKKIILPFAKPTLKNIFLYYKRFSFKDKLNTYQLLGNVRQNFVEILSRAK